MMWLMFREEDLFCQKFEDGDHEMQTLAALRHPHRPGHRRDDDAAKLFRRSWILHGDHHPSI